MFRMVLTPRERNLMHRLRAALQLPAFFDVWALKEAHLKMTGEGITGFKRVEALLGERGGVPQLGIKVLPHGGASPAGSAFRIDAGENLAAAVAVSAGPVSCRLLEAAVSDLF